MAVDDSSVSLRLRWPAEWEPHRATLLAWPTCRETWPGLFESIPRAFARLVLTIAECEPVILLASDDAARRQIDQLVGSRDRVSVLPVPVDDAWIRDYGPLGVWSGDRLRLVDFRFDAWGEKYPPWDRDDAATSILGRQLRLPVDSVDAVLEGGAIEGNGAGLLVATVHSVAARRTSGSLEQRVVIYERLLRRHLGVERFCWLHHGRLAGDDTDGHIDQLARFVSADRMVVACSRDPTDANYGELKELKRELARAISRTGDADSGKVDLVDLPIPRNVTFRGHRLPASYCNFLFVDGALIVPAFADRHDEQAVGILRELLPDRTIVPVPCRELVWGLGAVHCLTQTLPGRREPPIERPPSTR